MVSSASIPSAGADVPPRNEADEGGIHLFGDLIQSGVSIHWHDFQAAKERPKRSSRHEPRVEICLNFSGTARLHSPGGDVVLGPGDLATFIARSEGPVIMRGTDSLHRFMTLRLLPGFIQARCPGHVELLKQPIQALIGGECSDFLEVQPMNTAVLGMRGVLLDPPVSEAARSAWYLAKVMELLAHTAYRANEPGELFCLRHRRQSIERVERVRYLLERDLENPPSLGMLAREVGCSTFYLSRIFAEESGMSIPKFLRMRRIERAADFLRSKKMNVTEAAMAVGYSSLSAFNKAFVEQMGCCPGLYPVVKIPGRKPAVD